MWPEPYPQDERVGPVEDLLLGRYARPAKSVSYAGYVRRRVSRQIEPIVRIVDEEL